MSISERVSDSKRECNEELVIDDTDSVIYLVN